MENQSDQLMATASRDQPFTPDKSSGQQPPAVQQQMSNPCAEDPEEAAHFRNVVSAFFFYQCEALKDIARMHRDFDNMPKHFQQMLPFDYQKDRIQKLKMATNQNQAFLNLIVQEYQGLFEFQQFPNGAKIMKPELVKRTDVEKMRSTLKSLVREWSSFGKPERDQCFEPIMQEVNDYFVIERGMQPQDSETGQRISVLHPGCGLGRLVFEFAKRGYRSQGNEFAYFCLLTSNFILNVTERSNSYEINPYIHSFSNLKSTHDAFKKVQLPDECPSEIFQSNSNFDFSMVAGEFVECYQNQEKQWDCVVTCFFIDTAHNVCDYMACINNILKPGSLWVNIGPLLWHYADNFTEPQVELTWEEIKQLIPKFGFKLRKEEWHTCGYTKRPNCMMQMDYDAVFFSAVKEDDYQTPEQKAQADVGNTQMSFGSPSVTLKSTNEQKN